jgi:hypothetical protein
VANETPLKEIYRVNQMSVSKTTVQDRSLEARNTREKIQNTKSEREKSEGEKRSPPTLFSPVHRFFLLF